jgi:hypothetical protein
MSRPCNISCRQTLVRFIFGAGAICLIATLLSSVSAQEPSSDSVTQVSETPITEADRQHWAFRPIVTPAVPVPPDESELQPIDCFIQRRLETVGLRLQPAADSATLLRRLSFDLVGLPPTAADRARYASEFTDAAWQDLVDELLGRPEYGERWAQHWLDLARFAETDGFEHDKIRPDAWKYRDWVIAALNDDMPFDEFVRMQIAGDELYPNDPQALTATRFCLSGPDMPDINSQEERRQTLLNELTGTIGSAILGVQLGCAQCHDHKYDPISQLDFYRIRAVFAPAVHVTKNKSVTTLQETSEKPAPNYLWVRGDFRRRGPEVAAGVLRVVTSGSPDLEPVAVSGSSGRRLAFANWLVSQHNPLTARVIVNRVWQHHFGVGLCDTPGDFGYIGSEPTHEDLLNWLAAEFISNGWSIKWLHRQILSSACWRQRSRQPADADPSEQVAWNGAFTKDASGRLLSRFPRRRLEGEVVRDAMLAASGALNPARGGPGIRPPLPPEMYATLLKNQWNVTEDSRAHDRRSIYVFARRNLRYPMFDVFDRPDANASCTARNVTTTAPQALYLLNSAFSDRMSRLLAEQLCDTSAESAAIVSAAFGQLFARNPDEVETRACVQLLENAGFDKHPVPAVAELCLVLFNTNEFLYVD